MSYDVRDFAVTKTYLEQLGPDATIGAIEDAAPVKPVPTAKPKKTTPTVKREAVTIARYIERRGNNVRITVPVPRPLHAILGAKLRRNLGDVSNSEATGLHGRNVIRELEDRIEDARKLKNGSVDAEALRDKLPVKMETAGDVLAYIESNEKAEEIARTHSPEKARRYSQIARGRMVPMGILKDTWLRGIRATKTAHEFGKVFDHCNAFMEARGRDLTTITGSDVLAWRSHVQTEGKGRSGGTVNKYLSAMSSYYRHVMAHEAFDRNPFAGRWIDKSPRRRRGYAPAEIAFLFANGDAARKDLMSVALLGLRLNEAFGLQARHIEPGEAFTVLNVPGTKSDNAARRIPLPVVLVPLLTRLAAGKGPSDYLFVGGAVSKLRSRGQGAGKNYLRWMRSLKNPDGSKVFDDSVDFHSWRRTFATLCQKAGVPEFITAKMMGHGSKLGMSYGIYADNDLPLMKDAMDKAFANLPVQAQSHFAA